MSRRLRFSLAKILSAGLRRRLPLGLKANRAGLMALQSRQRRDAASESSPERQTADPGQPIEFSPRRPAVNDIEIGAAVIALTRTDMQVEAAVAEVMHQTGLKRSKVYAAYSNLNKALKRIQSEADRP